MIKPTEDDTSQVKNNENESKEKKRMMMYIETMIDYFYQKSNEKVLLFCSNWIFNHSQWLNLFQWSKKKTQESQARFIMDSFAFFSSQG